MLRCSLPAGYAVEREYYVNDAGTQTDTFAETLYARYQQLFGRNVDIPKDGYPGDYMIELAEQLKANPSATGCSARKAQRLRQRSRKSASS